MISLTRTSPTGWTAIARLLRPQGRKGEVLAELFTDFPGEIQNRPLLFLARPDFDGDVSEAMPAEVVAFFLPVGKNEGRIVMQLAGVTSIEDAERVSGLELITPRDARLPLEDEANYISDLVGCALFDRQIFAGTVEDVQFASSPDGRRRLSEAAPLLVLNAEDGEEVLVPFAKAFLVSVDLERRRIDMNLPEGLLGLNQPSPAGGSDRG